jgi:hypothetical protein
LIQKKRNASYADVGYQRISPTTGAHQGKFNNEVRKS